MPRRTPKRVHEPSSLDLIEALELDSPPADSLSVSTAEQVATAAEGHTTPEPELLDLSKLSDAEFLALCWRLGCLEYLLENHQLEVYRQIKRELWGQGGYVAPDGPQRRFVLEICRRWGKSFLSAVIAFELCLIKPGAVVYWAAETSEQVKKILNSVLRPLLAACPKDLTPHVSESQKKVTFRNGSVIMFAGCDDRKKADRLRGDGCDLFVIDEAGSIAILAYVVESIVSYMIADRDGRVLIPSTPARSPAHAFTTYCVQAEGGQGGYARRDVYDSRFSAAKLAELAQDVGGEGTAGWRREALVLRVVDADLAIIGEFSEPGAEDAITQPYCAACGIHYAQHEQQPHEFQWTYALPEYRDCYVGIDWGHFPDFTALAFCSWDFANATLVVEGDAELSKASTTEIANTITTTEARLWTELFKQPGLQPDERKVYSRVSDSDPSKLYELDKLHGVYVAPSARDDKEAAINSLKIRFQRRQIRIHPSCRRMIANLKAGIFKQRKGGDKRTFDRIPGFGHFDLIDALIFAHRNINVHRNPFPAQPHHRDGWRVPGQSLQPPVAAEYQDLATQWGNRHGALFPSTGRR